MSGNSKQIHLLGLSETHTNDTVTDGELSLRGFALGQKDRSAGRSGGVSLYIRDDLQYQRRNDLEIDNLKFLWI